MSTSSPPSAEEILESIDSGSSETAPAAAPKVDLRQLQKGEAACPNCRSREPWAAASWCPRCGYYPAFGTVVEPAEESPHWEEQPAEENPAASLWSAIPAWAWILLGGCAAVIGGSFYLKAAVPEVSRLGFLILAGAEFVCLVIQVLVFLAATTTSDKYSPFDLILKPLDIWKPTLAKLPASAWRLWIFTWAQTAGLCAVVVIGGINFDSLFDDWGVKKRAAPNLVHAITKQAREQREGSESLQQSMKDFAGEEEAEDAKKKNEAKQAPRLTAECLIIGYTEYSGGLDRILLATTVKNQIRFVGSISAYTIPEADRAELARRMPALKASHPLVKCSVDATWLRPKLVCEISFKGWSDSYQLKEPHFNVLLSDIDLK